MSYPDMRQRRKENNWTLAYVAKQIGTTKQQIQKIETNQRNPKLMTIFKLCELYQVECEEIKALFNYSQNHK